MQIIDNRLYRFLADRVGLGDPGRFFLSFAAFFGIVFLFLNAPFQVPDEHGHFYRAYQLTRGQLNGTRALLPAAVVEFSQTVSKDLPGNDQNRQSKRALLNEFSRPFQEQPEASAEFINTALHSPLPYLPPAVGIGIGRLARLNPILIFYLGRLANLTAWIGLMYLAVWTTPIHPRLFAALALTPMSLHQAASNSPDAFTNAISFLFVAFALRILMDDRPAVSWKDWAKIAGLVVALALCKSVYIVLAGLLMLVPLRRFRKQRVVLPLALGTIALGMVVGLAWLWYSSQFVDNATATALRLPTREGVAFIVQNPGTAAPILWRSVVAHTGYQMKMFIGILGWFDTVLPGWVYPLSYALLLLIALLEPHPEASLRWYERLWVLVLAAAGGLVMLATFFYPDSALEEGMLGFIQGRYYIPFALLYFLPFSQRTFSVSRESPFWLGIALLIGVVLLAAIRAMLWRYYAI